MKKKLFFVLIILIISISAIHAQTNQVLVAGQVFTANLTPGAVHTYRIQLGTDPLYYIELEDWDINSNNVDVVISVRHLEDAWFRERIDNQDANTICLYNIKNPISFLGADEGDASLAFIPNSWYIIEIRGYDSGARGTYRIVFY